ncbi:hypothetical protein ASPTUDRAFT_186205 [Aspergillus tubingensis CBS 134.48]|uniref:Uncharacterized protein n=1 Tax=Aspergillus tubingensis (strain CBS 134.48) TaxID=767770 RepID=A0A1L9NMB5_ASPTC|nr:hypothetical protein ASPTUDRAFT_186205 [Aspergillus tubingensis CBS 134.48]
MDTNAEGKFFSRPWVQKSKGKCSLSFRPDIVLVHDLDGLEFACEEGTGQPVSWFEDILISDSPDAHILSFCPSPDAIAISLFTGYGFRAQAWELLGLIQREREDKHRTESEIIFHAFGVEASLLNRFIINLGPKASKFKSIRHQTSFIGFFEVEALKKKITTTLSHVTTALEEIHSSFSSVAWRYKTATSKKVVAFRAERATEEVLDEWQILSSRIRRLTIDFPVDTQKLSDAHNARDARNLILSRFAPLHDLSLIPSTYSSQILKVLGTKESYLSWRDNGNSELLYVYGGEMTATAPLRGLPVGEAVVTVYSSFGEVPYFKRAMSTVLEVLIYRILATVVPAFEVIQPILDSFGQMPNHTLEKLWILVKSLWLCPDIKSVFYVFEGIDMCEDKMTDQLEALVALTHARSLSCKVLATSQTLNNATSGKAAVINLSLLMLQRQNL